MSQEVMTGMNATAAHTSLEKEWEKAKEKKKGQLFHRFLYSAAGIAAGVSFFYVGLLLEFNLLGMFMIVIGIFLVGMCMSVLIQTTVDIEVTLTDDSTYEWWQNICGQDSSKVRVIIDDVLISAEKGAALNRSQKAILGSLQKSAVASASEGEFPTQSHKEIALRVLRIILQEAETLPTTS